MGKVRLKQINPTKDSYWKYKILHISKKNEKKADVHLRLLNISVYMFNKMHNNMHSSFIYNMKKMKKKSNAPQKENT